jgi:hypothetical protein
MPARWRCAGQSQPVTQGAVSGEQERLKFRDRLPVFSEGNPAHPDGACSINLLLNVIEQDSRFGSDAEAIADHAVDPRMRL